MDRFPLTRPEDIPDLPLQPPGQEPQLPEEMTGEVLVMLALFEQLMAGITQRCPHVACRRRQACSGKKDVCAMAPLDPRTRAWLAAREAKPLLRECAGGN
jgi:hypothetical protein